MLTYPTVTSITDDPPLSPHKLQSVSRTPRRELATSNATRTRPHTAFADTRHTYVSLCVAAGIPPLQISRFAGHSKVTTTLGIYAHLFADDHSEAMAALDAMAAGPVDGDNVIRLWG